MKTICITVPLEFFNKIKKVAKNKQRSISGMFRYAIEKYLKKD